MRGRTVVYEECERVGVRVRCVCDGKETFHRWLSLWQNAVAVEMNAGVTETPFLKFFSVNSSGENRVGYFPVARALSLPIWH